MQKDQSSGEITICDAHIQDEELKAKLPTMRKVDFCDASTQTGNATVSSLKTESIREILKNEQDEGKLIQAMIANWTGETYTRTSTVKEEIAPMMEEKNTILVIKATPKDREEKEYSPTIPQQLERLLKDRVLGPGEIVSIVTSTTLLSETTSERNPEIRTYIAPISNNPDKAEITSEILSCFKRMQDVMEPGKTDKRECGYLIGSTNKRLQTPLMKVLECIGNRRDIYFTLHTSPKEFQKKAAAKQRVGSQVCKLTEEDEDGEWKTKKEIRKKKNMDTILLTPHEGSSYAEILKYIKNKWIHKHVECKYKEY